MLLSFRLTFWLAILAIGLISLMTRAPPGPFTPVPLGASKALAR